MQPTANQVHIDAPLTNISVAYMQDETNYVHAKVFPEIPVDKKSDVYFTYKKEDWFRDQAKPRVAGTESAGSGYGQGQDNYSCVREDFHKDVDYDTINNADEPLNPVRDATNFVTSTLLLRREVKWTNSYFKAGVWGTDVTPGALWSNYATSDPVNDVEVGKQTVLANTGKLPKTMVLGYQVFVQLKNHPELKDRIKYTSSRTITPEVLAMLFDIDEVLVCMAVQNTGGENEAAAMGFVQGKHALLCHKAQQPGILTPSAGYTFSWKGVSGGLGKTIVIKRIPMPHLESDRIEGAIAHDFKVVGADLGYFFQNVVA